MSSWINLEYLAWKLQLSLSHFQTIFKNYVMHNCNWIHWSTPLSYENILRLMTMTMTTTTAVFFLMIYFVPNFTRWNRQLQIPPSFPPIALLPPSPCHQPPKWRTLVNYEEFNWSCFQMCRYIFYFQNCDDISEVSIEDHNEKTIL